MRVFQLARMVERIRYDQPSLRGTRLNRYYYEYDTRGAQTALMDVVEDNLEENIKGNWVSQSHRHTAYVTYRVFHGVSKIDTVSEAGGPNLETDKIKGFDEASIQAFNRSKDVERKYSYDSDGKLLSIVQSVNENETGAAGPFTPKFVEVLNGKAEGQGDLYLVQDQPDVLSSEKKDLPIQRRQTFVPVPTTTGAGLFIVV